jgi:thiamine biosynthesis lipoprotein
MNTRQHFVWKFPSLLLLSALPFAVSCSSPPPLSPWSSPATEPSVIEKVLPALNARFKVRIWPSTPPNPAAAQKAFAAAIAQIRRVSLLTDGSKAKSDIALINAKASTGPVKVSKEVFGLLQLGQAMWQRTGGVFDLTFVRIQEANEKDDPNAGLEAGVQDSASDVARELKTRVGQGNLVLDAAKSEVRFSKLGIKLSVMGLARGYAAQKAAESLRSSGVAGFAVVVDGAGGDLVAAGGIALKDPKLMCVEHPNTLGTCAYRIQPTDPAATLYLAQSAVAERPGHVYDAKNGLRKARTGIATIVGADGAAVQAAAVAASAMDNKKAKEFLESPTPPRLAGVFFVNDFDITLNGSLQPFATATPIESVVPGAEKSASEE